MSHCAKYARLKNLCTDGENQIHSQLHKPGLYDEKYQFNKWAICHIQPSSILINYCKYLVANCMKYFDLKIL